MGAHIAVFWICFEDVPKAHCLEIVKGSHRDVMYDGTPFDGNDDTLPMYGDRGDYQLPRLPDVQAKANSGEVEILSWPLKRGDVVVFHPNALHGGGCTDANFRERNTLTLRFLAGPLSIRSCRPASRDKMPVARSS